MTLRLLLVGFIAGALAVPTFHQAMIWGLYTAGLLPNPPFSMRPLPPFGVPQIASQSFWGGVWGLLIALILHYRPRWPVLAIGAAVGIFGAGLIALTLVPTLRGQPMAITDAARVWRSALINGVWGLGAGMILASLRGRLR